MKKSIFYIALLLVAIISSNRTMAIELDTVWVSDINGSILSQHSISKNIFIATNGGIAEVNSQDGKLVRSFPLSGSCIEFSPDGNKVLYCAPDGVRVFNITTLEDVLTITTKYWYPKFLGNDKIVFLSGLKNDTEIGIYDLQNKEIKLFPFSSNNFTTLATSPNGKYIAYATFEEITNIESKAHLYLLDAETMKGLGELGSWESQGHNILEIQFSSDSKFVTYTPSSFQETFPINIYNLESFTISKNVNPNDLQFETCSLILLDSNYYIIRVLNLFNQKSEIRICNLVDNKIIYISNDIQMYIRSAKFDTEKKHLFCYTPTHKIFCFDLNNIISGVAPVTPINTSYINKTLFINSNDKPLKQISIMTIEGREVFSQSFEGLVNISNPIVIPLALSNGCFIINLVSDKETYTEKIIIVE